MFRETKTGGSYKKKPIVPEWLVQYFQQKPYFTADSEVKVIVKQILWRQCLIIGESM